MLLVQFILLIFMHLITCCFSLVMATEHIQEFACFTDYAEKLICHWKVPAQLNCSQEFLLYYRKEFFPPE